MRLIDADTLKDTLLKHRYTTEHYQIFRYIDEQPTAYGIDKVVEELESNSFITVKNEEVQTKRKDIQSYIAVEKEVVLLKDAKEIVKHGGVSDVCEWKLDGVYLHSPHKPLVSCVTDENYRYYYCPYCGKKIKVVE